MSLERVIAEQQERIDRLEKEVAICNKNSRLHYDLNAKTYSALGIFIHEINRSIINGEIPNKERYFRLRDNLKKSAEDAGYCWRCENFGCVCDYGCEE